MRRQLVRVLSASPWLLLVVGTLAREYSEEGPRIVVALMIWIACVSAMVMAVALFGAATDRREQDDQTPR